LIGAYGRCPVPVLRFFALASLDGAVVLCHDMCRRVKSPATGIFTILYLYQYRYCMLETDMFHDVFVYFSPDLDRCRAPKMKRWSCQTRNRSRNPNTQCSYNQSPITNHQSRSHGNHPGQRCSLLQPTANHGIRNRTKKGDRQQGFVLHQAREATSFGSQQPKRRSRPQHADPP